MQKTYVQRTARKREWRQKLGYGIWNLEELRQNENNIRVVTFMKQEHIIYKPSNCINNENTFLIGSGAQMNIIKL